MTTTRRAFQVVGTTDDVTTCGLCGRDELRGTIVLAVLDADGNDTGERNYYGSTCGAKAAGWTVAEINHRVQAAHKAKLDAAEQDAAAYSARRFEALVTWAGQTLGITDRKALRDFAIFKQFCESDAYTVFQAAENRTPATPASGPVVDEQPRAMRQPTDRPRKGANRPARTGRAARARVGHHMSIGRRHAVLDALVARVNAGKLTAAQYLADVLGADGAFIGSYAGPFGKAIATAWRAVRGTDPQRTGLALVGRRLVSVFAYSADELPILQAAAEAYPRTAALLTARP